MINKFINYIKNIEKKHRCVINHTYNYVIKKFANKYAFKTKKQKYDLKTIIAEIIYFLKSGVSYEYYRGVLNPKTLNKHILFFSRNKIFENVYRKLFSKYSKKKAYTKFKYQHTDTSFIANKNGKQSLGRNKYFKNKKCYKLSFITDSNGIPNSVLIKPGNINDAKIGEQNIKSHCKEIKQINIKYRPYILADKIYDTKDFRKVCISNNYKPIIDYNRRNIKNRKLIKKLTKKEKKIYRKRIKVENSFAIIKKYKRLQTIYDSYFSTYKSFLYLSLCSIIDKYI